MAAGTLNSSLPKRFISKGPTRRPFLSFARCRPQTILALRKFKRAKGAWRTRAKIRFPSQLEVAARPSDTAAASEHDATTEPAFATGGPLHAHAARRSRGRLTMPGSFQANSLQDAGPRMAGSRVAQRLQTHRVPTTAASDVDFKHCLNCASQCTWEKDLQTCRSCNAKFKQKQAAGAPRVRMCPACRSRSKTTV